VDGAIMESLSPVAAARQKERAVDGLNARMKQYVTTADPLPPPTRAALYPLNQDQLSIGPALPQLDERSIFRVLVPRTGLFHRRELQHNHYTGKWRRSFERYSSHRCAAETGAIIFSDSMANMPIFMRSSSTPE
jgi:hypothetical protein